MSGQQNGRGTTLTSIGAPRLKESHGSRKCVELLSRNHLAIGLLFLEKYCCFDAPLEDLLVDYLEMGEVVISWIMQRRPFFLDSSGGSRDE